MYISRVDREMSDDNMRDWISTQKINIINFERLSHDDAKYKSYKLIVSVSAYVSLCKPSQWPVGICISKFYPPKATEIMVSIRKFTVCSYNMCGFNSNKYTYILGRCDILLLQEHWSNNNKLATFNGYFPGNMNTWISLNFCMGVQMVVS